MGDCQKRDDLLSHPQVESILFIMKNNLIELFHPQLVKEFDPNCICTIKLARFIGKTLENYSILSIADASKPLSDNTRILVFPGSRKFYSATYREKL